MGAFCYCVRLLVLNDVDLYMPYNSSIIVSVAYEYKPHWSGMFNRPLSQGHTQPV
jgi:hypothetical protein